jgi:non-heme chloroperoxidase
MSIRRACSTLRCVDGFGRTDFRKDLGAFTVPTLVVHGTSDKIAPIDAAGRAPANGIVGARLVEYEGEPHGLFAIAYERLNADLKGFIG